MVDPEFLAGVSLFARLSGSELQQLAAEVHERRYSRGTRIFAEGDPGEAAYVVREGRVKVYRVSPDGHEQIIGLFGPGAPFGLVVALDGAPYPAHADAVEDSVVWIIRREHLQGLISVQPPLASGVMREVGDRLRRAQDRVHSLAARTVHQRIAQYLLDLAGAQEQTAAKGGTARVRMTMTHQELGSYIGASRETVTRALAEFRREGAIRAEADDALIVHTDRVRRWLE